MDKIFSNTYIRNKFIFTIIIYLLFLLLIRYCLLPIDSLSEKSNENIGSFIDRFVTSVFTAVIVGYFLYLMQIEEKKREIEFTDSGYEIEKHLSKARTETEKWYFNGGLGRYTKFSTIPKLSKIASDERKTISVNLIMINPFNKQLLEKYISFRISLENESKKINWTELEVQSEILATIITALYYKKTNQFLNISINIKNFFTLTRMDISNSIAVITREDPSIPSIIAKSDTYMYKHYSEEFQQVLRQSSPIDYIFPELNTPSNEEIIQCLSTIFPTEFSIENFNQALIDKTINKFNNPKNPF